MRWLLRERLVPASKAVSGQVGERHMTEFGEYVRLQATTDAIPAPPMLFVPIHVTGNGAGHRDRASLEYTQVVIGGPRNRELVGSRIIQHVHAVSYRVGQVVGGPQRFPSIRRRSPGLSHIGADVPRAGAILGPAVTKRATTSYPHPVWAMLARQSSPNRSRGEIHAPSI